MGMNFGFANRHSTSGRSGGMPIGNISAGQSFPTTRPDGSPLQLGDYVKPIGTLPFTVGSITFTSYRDTASWNTVEWVLNANPYQNTSETPVANKAEESLSGNSNYQNQINKEVKEKFSEMKAKDVYVNGETVVDDNGIAQINVATSSKAGVVKAETPMGIGCYTEGTHKGKLYIVKATNDEIKAKSDDKKPIVSSNLDKAIMEGLGNNALNWPEEYKEKARETLGVESGGGAVFDNKTIILEDGKRRTAIGGYMTTEPTDIMLIPEQDGVETDLGSGIYFNFVKVRQIYLAVNDLVSVEVDIRTDTEHITAACTDKTPQEYTIAGIGTCLGVELEGGTVEGNPIIYLDKNYGCVYCEGFQHHNTLHLGSATVKRDMPVFYPLDPRYIPTDTSLYVKENEEGGVTVRRLGAKVMNLVSNVLEDTGFGLLVQIDNSTIKKTAQGIKAAIGGECETHSRYVYLASQINNLVYAKVHSDPDVYGIIFPSGKIETGDEYGSVSMRITHQDSTYQDFVEDHTEVTTKEFLGWAMTIATKLNYQLNGHDVYICNDPDGEFCFIWSEGLVPTDTALIVELKMFREVTDYTPINAGYIPISEGAGNAVQKKPDGIFVAGTGAQIDGESIVINASGRMKTAIGGGMRTVTRTLTHHSDDTSGHYVPESESGYPLPFILFGNPVNVWHIGDEATVKLSINGVVYEQTKTVKSVSMIGETFRAIQLDDIIQSGSTTYIAESMFGTLFYSTAPFSATDVFILLHSEFVRTEEVRQHIDPLFIPIDLTSIVVNENGDLGVLISQQSGNALQLKSDGLYAASGGGSVHEDEFTVTAQTAVMCEHTIGIKHPYIVCIDSEGCECIGSVDYIDNTKFTIEFNQPFTGKIFVH